MRHRNFDHNVLVRLLTPERLGSYLDATDHDPIAAIQLYDWNVLVSGALIEDIARLEVVFRNVVDSALVTHQHRRGQPTAWYRDQALLSKRANTLVRAARDRATRSGRPERHGKVIAELNFGFWRFLCAKSYLTSLWVPALASAFPYHPRPCDPRTVRTDIHDRMKQLNELRNRIAHHEPVHKRDLDGDSKIVAEIAGWISPDARKWIVANSRTREILDRRP